MTDGYWTTALASEILSYLKNSRGLPGSPQLVLPKSNDITGIAATDVAKSSSLNDIDGMNINNHATLNNNNYCKVGNNIYITKYADQKVCPYSKFHLKVLRDLQAIALQASGRRLLRSLDKKPKSGSKVVIIKFCDGYMRTSQANLDPSESGGNWNPSSGAPDSTLGQLVTVEYNPQMFGLPVVVGLNDNGAEVKSGAWGSPEEKPPDVTLFHEMVHADDYFRGVFLQTEAFRANEKVKISEIRCVGLDQFAVSEIYSENSYRSERGVKTRSFYTKVTEMNGGPVFKTDTSSFFHPFKYSSEKKSFSREVKTMNHLKKSLADYLTIKLAKIKP